VRISDHTESEPVTCGQLDGTGQQRDLCSRFGHHASATASDVDGTITKVEILSRRLDFDRHGDDGALFRHLGQRSRGKL
jgi:hypothetical protein